MPSIPKIKINDNNNLRVKIDLLVNQANQVTLCKWAIIVAKSVLPYLDEEFPNCQEIREGFAVQEQWQMGLVCMHDVRQAGFAIHQVARRCQSDTAKYAARTAGQAVGVGHMREHAMVCSDYAIKTINCDSRKGVTAVSKQRQFQLEELERLYPLQGESLA